MIRPNAALAALLTTGIVLAIYARASAQPDEWPAAEVQYDTVTDEQANAFATDIYEAIDSGQWLAAIGAALMLFVWGVRKFGGKIAPTLCTQAAGRILAVGSAAIVTVASAFLSGRPPSYGLFLGALALAWTSSGMWTDVKDARAEVKR